MTSLSPNNNRPRVRRGIMAFLLGLMAAFASTGASLWAAEDLNQIIDRIQVRYEEIESLESDFTQIRKFEGFSTAMTSTGKLYLRKGNLRWDYHEPSKHQIFVEGDRVLFYVPEHNQVIKSRLGADLDAQVPARLLAGTGNLRRDFFVRWADPGVPHDAGGNYLLTLVPKTPSQLAEIRLAVDSKEFIIRRIALLEPGGNRSDFEFSRIRINPGLKDSIFLFEVPKGVVVVEQP